MILEVAGIISLTVSRLCVVLCPAGDKAMVANKVADWLDEYLAGEFVPTIEPAGHQMGECCNQ